MVWLEKMQRKILHCTNLMSLSTWLFMICEKGNMCFDDKSHSSAGGYIIFNA